jgi:hypothetical protein
VPETPADDGRAVLTARLRAMADWLDANPGVPLSPYSEVQINYFTNDIEEARAAREAARGGWRKQTSPTASYVTYEHGDTDGGEFAGKWAVTYAIHVAKAATCERVQVGVRHVEEHDEPVYEWKCDA